MGEGERGRVCVREGAREGGARESGYPDTACQSIPPLPPGIVIT